MRKTRKSLKLRNTRKHTLISKSIIKSKFKILVDKIKLQKIRKIVSPKIFYNKIKYKSDIYSIGDCILIRDSNEGFLVAKLEKIIKNNGYKKYPFWPTIEVQW